MDLSQMTQIKKMFDIVNTSSNPQAMMEAMAKSNPALKQIMSDLSSTSSSPKDVFYKRAKEMGMTDDQISNFLSQLKNMM